MALKPKDIRAMNAQDRVKALLDNRAELMHERGLSAMGGAVKNPGRIRDLRTSIARLLTVERELQGDGRPAAKPARRPAPAPAKAPAKAPTKAAAKAPAKPSKGAKPAAKPAAKETKPVKAKAGGKGSAKATKGGAR